VYYFLILCGFRVSGFATEGRRLPPTLKNRLPCNVTESDIPADPGHRPPPHHHPANMTP